MLVTPIPPFSEKYDIEGVIVNLSTSPLPYVAILKVIFPSLAPGDGYPPLSYNM